MGNSSSVATLGLGPGPGAGGQGLGPGLSQGSGGPGPRPGLSQGSRGLSKESEGLMKGMGSPATQGSRESYGKMMAGNVPSLVHHNTPKNHTTTAYHNVTPRSIPWKATAYPCNLHRSTL